MSNRRSFLRHSFFTTLAAGLGLAACEASPRTGSQNGGGRHNPASVAATPVAIATWAPNTKATQAAMEVLQGGGKALDAVEQGARVPEADPDDTSVGLGGLPDRDGNVTLDACIMEPGGNAGSVTYLQHILHPVSVARRVMEETPHVILSGEGALQFALDQGFERHELLTEKARKAWEDWKAEQYEGPRVSPQQHDTIGILAIDQQGDIAGACTTSGAGFKYPGRVGDSPIIGAGMYIDNEVGGACATGWGELVLRTLGSFLIVELMRQGMTPQEACEEGVNRILAKYSHELKNDFGVGYIAIDKQGQHGAYSIGPGFTYALHQNGENKVLTGDSHRKG